LRGLLPTLPLLGPDVNIVSTFLKILIINTVIGGIIFCSCNFIKLKDLPLGYVAVWCQIFIYGLVKGTNSFEYPYPSLQASFIGFLRTGLWEFTAYILTVCSTANIALYRQDSWFSSNLTKVRDLKDVKLCRNEIIAYFTGILILVASALTESLAIFKVIP